MCNNTTPHTNRGQHEFEFMVCLLILLTPSHLDFTAFFAVFHTAYSLWLYVYVCASPCHLCKQSQILATEMENIFELSRLTVTAHHSFVWVYMCVRLRAEYTKWSIKWVLLNFCTVEKLGQLWISSAAHTHTLTLLCGDNEYFTFALNVALIFLQ